MSYLAGIIYLRSHLGKYLSVDSFGNVLCESDERDAGSRFQISIAEDGSGRWALRNESRGYFLGGTPDKLTCTAKAPSNGEFWTVHLAARPQVSEKWASIFIVFPLFSFSLSVWYTKRLILIGFSQALASTFQIQSILIFKANN